MNETERRCAVGGCRAVPLSDGPYCRFHDPNPDRRTKPEPAKPEAVLDPITGQDISEAGLREGWKKLKVDPKDAEHIVAELEAEAAQLDAGHEKYVAEQIEIAEAIQAAQAKNNALLAAEYVKQHKAVVEAVAEANERSTLPADTTRLRVVAELNRT
jgi:hypothetical protein